MTLIASAPHQRAPHRATVRRVVACALAVSGLLSMTAVRTAGAASPANINGALAPRSAQFMLYVSHTIGGARIGAVTRPTFGLMVEQIRQVSNTGGPEGGDSLVHRELINWQMNLRQGVRIGLGHKITYDVTRRSFGSPATRAGLTIDVATLRGTSAGVTEPKTIARGFDSGPMPGKDVQDPSIARRIAATVMSALSPASFTSAQRRNIQRRLLPPTHAPGLR